jgi:transcriptional regulator with XRE-family HTH domain
MKEMLHKQIFERRRALRMTQKELAELATTSLDNLKKIEQGRGLPKVETLVSIASTLNTSVDTLLFGEKPDPQTVFPEIESLFIRLSPSGRKALIGIAEEIVALEVKLRSKGV